MSPLLRLALAMLSCGAWLFVLLLGLAPALVAHLLLVAALLLFPWRALGVNDAASRRDPPP